MKTSRTGIALIKKWEGCRLSSYQCSAGVWTIGYGLTSAAGIIPVKPGMKITQAQADEYLVASLVKYEAAVQNALRRSPNQNQFDACVSLCFNIGPGAFAGSSIVRRFNEGDAQGAADAFRLWNKAGGKVLQGLVNRREEERALFLRPSVAPVAVRHDEPVIPHTLPKDPVEDAPRPSLWASISAWWRRTWNS